MQNSAEQLSVEQKKLLLAKMLAKKQANNSYTLSAGQERIWLHSQINENDPLYNVAITYDLEGSLNIEAIKQSLAKMMERHQTLRTRFNLVDEQPVQIIETNIEVPLSLVDLSNMPLEAQQREAEKLINETAKKPFKLTQAPLWEMKLLRYSQDKHTLFLVMHHIVSDGWSFIVFLQELRDFYAAYSKGETANVPELPSQYTDFAQKHKALLQGEKAAKQREFWSQNLAGEVETIKLPVTRTLSTLPSHAGTCQKFALSPSLTEGLRNLSKQEKVTIFMLLLAAFQILLHSYSQQQDLVVCTPVSGRHYSKSKELIGYFNNILPIRTNLSPNDSLKELIQRVRQDALNAYKHQDIPLQSLIDLPNLAQTTLTKVLFSVDMLWPPVLSLEGIKVSNPLNIHTGRVNFDISASIWEESEQIKGVWDYKTDLFDHNVIEQMLIDYQNLLQKLVDNPQQAISSISLESKIPEKLASASSAPSEKASYKAPRSIAEFEIAKIWEEVLGVNNVGVYDNLFALGASSLAVAKIGQKIQAKYEKELPLAAIFQAPTVEKMADLLQTDFSCMPTSALAPIQPNGEKPPIFFCEGVGIYSGLIPYLGEDQPVYGLMRDIGDQSENVEKIAADYLKEVREVQPCGPYYLGGISYGGLVAFEMAQQLQSAGEEVAMLALFDTPGPGAYKLKPKHLRVLGHLHNLIKFGKPYLDKQMQRRKRRAQIHNQPSQAKESLEVDKQAFRRLAVLSAKEYHHKPYPGPITLFALKERSAMTDSLFDPAVGYVDPLLGWGKVAQQQIEAHYYPGAHTTILREPQVKALGEQLRICLDKAQAK